MRKALIAIVVLVVLVAVAGALYLGSQKDKSSKVSVKKVAADAKKHVAKARHVDPGLRPAPGTYDYVGAGGDHVSALGGSSHTFPRHLAAVITLQDGCNWTIHFVYLKEKTKDRHMCTDAQGARETGSVEKISFFGTTETQHFTCDRPGGDRLRAGAKVGDTWSAHCATGDRDVAHRVRVLDIGPFRAGADTVPKAWHVDDASTLTGASRGTDDTQFWWAPSGLPLRILEQTKLRSKALIGDTDYTVRSDYRLTGLTPS